MIDKIAVVTICSFLFLVGYAMVNSLNNTEKKEAFKSALYKECIATDYDKFQCYAMIYGDK